MFRLVTHSTNPCLSLSSLPLPGQSSLGILTDPPTNGSVHYFCGSGAASNFTIICNYSTSIITPDIVINGVKSPVSALGDPYNVVANESAVVIRFPLSSSQNMYNFSCAFTDTASRTITLEEGMVQDIDIFLNMGSPLARMYG